MRVTAVIGLIGAGLVLAGCGSGTVSGDADAEGTAAGEPVFSPCDDIPVDLLEVAGVDPATAERDIDGVKQPGWNRCRWAAEDYSLTVFATTRTMSAIRANERNTDFVDYQVAGRDALAYRETSDLNRERCDVAMASDGGASIVRINVYRADTRTACEQALALATVLSPSIPE
ncbi:DUF3558 domain-containing protein [Prescottella equi]|uniref:DUF3558 domain-containing protein n=1 Tax=Rhodococcus hoagii TaxID=43767 RepID=UPI000A0F8C1E|nr:DUF3558 domain-containing protein [Prescottella equi]MBM4588407.1 DUF3558 domain-containing protein [Prescottella equi]ORL10291.1 hypothetical protein A6I85_19020 [Prescottella equi]